MSHLPTLSQDHVPLEAGMTQYVETHGAVIAHMCGGSLPAQQQSQPPPRHVAMPLVSSYMPELHPQRHIGHSMVRSHPQLTTTSPSPQTPLPLPEPQHPQPLLPQPQRLQLQHPITAAFILEDLSQPARQPVSLSPDHCSTYHEAAVSPQSATRTPPTSSSTPSTPFEPFSQSEITTSKKRTFQRVAEAVTRTEEVERLSVIGKPSAVRRKSGTPPCLAPQAQQSQSAASQLLSTTGDTRATESTLTRYLSTELGQGAKCIGEWCFELPQRVPMQ